MPRAAGNSDEDEWPEPPFVGFVPLDDRLEGRKHTKRLMELEWEAIQRRWRTPWREVT